MWLLVRRGESPDGVLASCPDTTQGREPWQWTVSRDAGGHVVVDTDDDRVVSEVVEVRVASVVSREAGSIVTFVPSSGEWAVASSSGPWSRTLAPGDVFLAEDDRAEELRVIPADGAVCLALSMATLRPVRGDAPLRWIP